jgi:hypothetical protein
MTTPAKTSFQSLLNSDTPEEVFEKKTPVDPKIRIGELETEIRKLLLDMEGLIQEREQNNARIEDWTDDKQLIDGLRAENHRLKETNLKLSKTLRFQLTLMLTLSKTGIPGITCGKCQEPFPVDSICAMKHDDLSSVTFVCIDCAEKLKQTYPSSTWILARVYFEALLATGRPKRVLQLGS